jgi:hypothetical protein
MYGKGGGRFDGGTSGGGYGGGGYSKPILWNSATIPPSIHNQLAVARSVACVAWTVAAPPLASAGLAWQVSAWPWTLVWAHSKRLVPQQITRHLYHPPRLCVGLPPGQTSSGTTFSFDLSILLPL